MVLPQLKPPGKAWISWCATGCDQKISHFSNAKTEAVGRPKLLLMLFLQRVFKVQKLTHESLVDGDSWYHSLDVVQRSVDCHLFLVSSVGSFHQIRNDD